jgi:hypothetical protein
MDDFGPSASGSNNDAERGNGFHDAGDQNGFGGDDNHVPPMSLDEPDQQHVETYEDLCRHQIVTSNFQLPTPKKKKKKKHNYK